MKVVTYALTTASGKHVRKATKVVFDDGHEIAFLDRLSRREALRQVAMLPVSGA